MPVVQLMVVLMNSQFGLLGMVDHFVIFRMKMYLIVDNVIFHQVVV